MQMTISIVKMVGIIDKTVLHAVLRRLEPTPKPTPWQKAGVYKQKAPGFGDNAAGYEEKAAGLNMVASLRSSRVCLIIFLLIFF